MNIASLIGRDLIAGTLLSYLATKKVRQEIKKVLSDVNVDAVITTMSIPESAADATARGAAFLAGVLTMYINPIPTSKLYGGVGTILAVIGE